MQTVDVLLRFSKTPLKHRMSKYLIEFMLENQQLLENIVFVTTRKFLPNTMAIAQAGAEGPSFELELGAREREDVTLENGKHVKQTRRIGATLVHDPVQAVECLKKFNGKLHIQLLFAETAPNWYEEVAVTDPERTEDFPKIVREQLDLALELINLKQEIDKALQHRDRETFHQKVQKYNRISQCCLWDL